MFSSVMLITGHPDLSSSVTLFLSSEKHVTLLGYSNSGFCDTLSIASNIQWYELIPHKATAFIPCLYHIPFKQKWDRRVTKMGQGIIRPL
jgi:hypothetical protein